MPVITFIWQVEGRHDHMDPDDRSVRPDVPLVHRIHLYLALPEFPEVLHVFLQVVRVRDPRPSRIDKFFLGPPGYALICGIDPYYYLVGIVGSAAC